jgi:hypothetical protein
MDCTSDHLKIINQVESTPDASVQVANGAMCCKLSYRSSAQRFFCSIFRQFGEVPKFIDLLYRNGVKMIKIFDPSTGAIVDPMDVSRTMAIKAIKPPGF